MKNWNSYRKRYTEYWKRNVPDNRIIAHIQNPNPAPSVPPKWMLEMTVEKYLDPEKLFKFKEERKKLWNWHAELFDYTTPSYGPNVFAGFCGAKVEFGKDTVWHEPVISSLDESDKIHFDTDNYYWRKHLEAVDYFCNEAAPFMQLGMTDFGGPADWISSIMGTENLLIQTIEFPDRMRDFAMRLAEECNSAFNIVFAKISAHNDGTANWMPVWSDFRMGTVQDDMSVNFSPEMYADVFFPAIQKMAGNTKKTVLHWHDGCSQHIDNILKINEIDLIQYGHDPNTGSFKDKIETMRKIQAAGKFLFISCVDMQDAEFFVKNLDPHGLMMIINTPDDKASARTEENVGIWTEDRLKEI